LDFLGRLGLFATRSAYRASNRRSPSELPSRKLREKIDLAHLQAKKQIRSQSNIQESEQELRDTQVVLLRSMQAESYTVKAKSEQQLTSAPQIIIKAGARTGIGPKAELCTGPIRMKTNRLSVPRQFNGKTFRC